MSYNKKMSIIGFWMAAIPLMTAILAIVYIVGQRLVVNEAYLWAHGKYGEFWAWIIIPVLVISFVAGMFIWSEYNARGYYD